MINANRPELWKRDIQESVKLYNTWFLEAAPAAYRDTRWRTIGYVEQAFVQTQDLTMVTPAVLRVNPQALAALRMCTAPPIARDRLVGLSYGSKGLVGAMEKNGRLPPRMDPVILVGYLNRMCEVIGNLLDKDLFPWVGDNGPVEPRQRELAVTVVADRLCGAETDPIVRNAQERRQLSLIKEWLTARGYRYLKHPSNLPITDMAPGTFSFHQNVPVNVGDGSHSVNIPVDVAIQSRNPAKHRIPILVEAKSAGDFTNVNKRRKEEGKKIEQLRATYGKEAALLLFLCGYFDAGYLGYSAAEKLDWVWEHRISDLEAAGV